MESRKTMSISILLLFIFFEVLRHHCRRHFFVVTIYTQRECIEFYEHTYSNIDTKCTHMTSAYRMHKTVGIFIYKSLNRVHFILCTNWKNAMNRWYTYKLCAIPLVDDK